MLDVNFYAWSIIFLKNVQDVMHNAHKQVKPSLTQKPIHNFNVILCSDQVMVYVFTAPALHCGKQSHPLLDMPEQSPWSSKASFKCPAIPGSFYQQVLTSRSLISRQSMPIFPAVLSPVTCLKKHMTK